LAILSEVLALLDKWGPWKRITEAPGRLDDLEKRLAALERTAPRQAGKSCPACGEPAVRRTSSIPHPDRLLSMAGITQETWECSACGDKEIKQGK
jgi:hypothetical protein